RMPRRIFCQKRHESNHVGTHGRASVSASGIRSLSKRIQPKADRDRRLCPKATATLTFVNYGLIAALTERACPKMHHSRFLSRRFFSRLADARGCSENTYPESWGRGFIVVHTAGLFGLGQAREGGRPVCRRRFGKPCFQLF